MKSLDIHLRRRDRFRERYAFKAAGGRVITDLVTTDGSTTATSATAAFGSGDNGRQIATADGTFVADGTTMTVVNATTITLSAPATDTGDAITAVLRAADCSAWSDHRATMKTTEDGDLLIEFTADVSRATVGVFRIRATGAQTATLDNDGVWDWQILDEDDEPFTLFGGTAYVDLDVTP